MGLVVRKPGVYTSIQDNGRFGYQLSIHDGKPETEDGKSALRNLPPPFFGSAVSAPLLPPTGILTPTT